MSALQAGRTLADYARIVRRRWVYPATILPAMLLLAVFLAYALPATYRSTGVIMIESSSISGTVVPSSVDELRPQLKDSGTYIDQQLDLVRRRVVEIAEMKKLVSELDPYPDESDLTAGEKAQLIAKNTNLERVDPITLKQAVESMAFSVSYDNPDPVLAQKVNAKIIERFIDYNHRTRSEAAAEAYKFLRQQAEDMEGSMRDMEKKLAQFKAKFGDALPDAEARNLAGIDRVQRDLDGFERDMRVADEKVSTLELQVAQTPPSLVSAVADWRVQLATLKAQLADAQQRYTPEHPEMKRLQRAIADLVAQNGSRDAINAKAAPPDNPEYLMYSSQLASARRDLAALRMRVTQARSDLSKYNENVVRSPNVGQQYTLLTRDYETTIARYQDVQNKMKAAALAQNFESEARGQRFTRIKGADMPDSPEFPNRLGIILIGFVLGGGLALGAAAVVEASDPSVRGTDDLQDIMETTPIGAVPIILNPKDVRRRHLVFGSVTAGYLVAAIIVAITVMSVA
jgi:succinoglycan biosynthesis transport protein ExoP